MIKKIFIAPTTVSRHQDIFLLHQILDKRKKNRKFPTKLFNGCLCMIIAFILFYEPNIIYD